MAIDAMIAMCSAASGRNEPTSLALPRTPIVSTGTKMYHAEVGALPTSLHFTARSPVPHPCRLIMPAPGWSGRPELLPRQARGEAGDDDRGGDDVRQHQDELGGGGG